MRIAIILPGHVRAWSYCRENFLETLYNKNHDIDVFVETYNQLFRSDYSLHNENQMQITKSDDEIKEMFSGINVKYFGIEPELTGSSGMMQKRKILKCYEEVKREEEQNGKYGLLVRSRFDLLLDNPLDYDTILSECTQNEKLIYIGLGAVHMTQNDMFAACKSDAFSIYINRLNEYPTNEDMIHHWSMDYIKEKHGIEYRQVIDISIVRLDGNGNFKVEK
jgi:hypothetical protein